MPSARCTGATFMKLGRAPTTRRTVVTEVLPRSPWGRPERPPVPWRADVHSWPHARDYPVHGGLRLHWQSGAEPSRRGAVPGAFGGHARRGGVVWNGAPAALPGAPRCGG